MPSLPPVFKRATTTAPLLPYQDLLAVRDALAPYIEQMEDSSAFAGHEQLYADLQDDWKEVNRQIHSYRREALRRWQTLRHRHPMHR